MGEKEELEAALSRLRLDVDELAPLESGGDDDDTTQEKNSRRREMQLEMEVASHRLAELQELEYVERVKQQCLKTGLIESPMMRNKLEKCPLCHDTVPETYRYDEGTGSAKMLCCGAACCTTCYKNMGTRMERAEAEFLRVDQAMAAFRAKRIAKLPPGISSAVWKTKKAVYDESSRCTFCRAEFSDESELYRTILRHAKAGQDWAQMALATQFMDEGDFTKAEHWMKLAAQQGNVDAQAERSAFWTKGRPFCGIMPSPQRAQEYLRPAARAGHATAQFLCGNAAMAQNNPTEAYNWFYLAASQGFRMAQATLGFKYFGDGRGVRRDTSLALFKSIYWYRQAALKNEPAAQEKLSSCLLAAKMQLFDGSCDIVGYSAIPEAAFWYEVASKDQAQAAKHSFQKSKLLDVTCCACCKKAADRQRTIVLQRCVRCKAVGYCGKECQTLHWNIGHKIDCKGVDKWKKALNDELAKPTASSPYVS